MAEGLCNLRATPENRRAYHVVTTNERDHRRRLAVRQESMRAATPDTGQDANVRADPLAPATPSERAGVGDEPVAAPADDIALVEAACSGDRAALQELLEAQYESIYRICRRMMLADADALDATQDAVVNIVRGIATFDRRSSFSTWSYRVTTNACLSALRSRARRRSHELLSAEPDTASREASRGGRLAGLTDTATGNARTTGVDRSITSDDSLANHVATAVDLDNAMSLVPPQFRAALLLRSSEGLSYEEIAQTLAIPVGTVRSRIARARVLLARELFGVGAEQLTGELDAGAMHQSNQVDER